jgi:MFS family permease
MDPGVTRAASRGWALGLLTVIYTFGFIDRMVMSVLGQPIKAELGLTDLQLGLIGGLTFALFNAILSIPLARIAERRNRIALVAAGVLLWSLATMGCGVVTGFFTLLFMRLGVGIGEAVVPAVNSVISDMYPRERRASALSIYMLAIPLGAFAGAALGGFIAQRWGWRAAFFAAGAPGIVLASVLRLSVPEPVRGRYDPPFADLAPPLLDVLRRMRARPAMLHAMAAAGIASAAGYGNNFFLTPVLFRRYGLDITHAGLLAGTINAIPGIVSILASGMLADAAAKRDMRFYAWIPAVGVFLAFPLYCFSLSRTTWQVATIGLCLTGLVQYTYVSCTAAIVQNMMRPRMRASAAAIYGVLTTLVGLGCGPLIVGALSDFYARHAHAAATAACVGSLPAQTCGKAAPVGLHWAMMTTAALYVWAAFHYWRASRTLRQDLAAA